MNTYRPSAIANEFLRRTADAERPMTPMQLLKLVYITHGWHFVVYEEPLIEEEVQAWKHGPVVESLFHQFKEFGGNPITKLSEDMKVVYGEPGSGSWIESVETDTPFLKPEDAHRLQLIDWVWKKYGEWSAFQLSSFTHESISGWSKAVVRMMETDPKNEWKKRWPIKDSEIREEFLNRWQQMK